jgi:uncharacterized protein YdcH (DUF465 family)
MSVDSDSSELENLKSLEGHLEKVFFRIENLNDMIENNLTNSEKLTDATFEIDLIIDELNMLLVLVS